MPPPNPLTRAPPRPSLLPTPRATHQSPSHSRTGIRTRSLHSTPTLSAQRIHRPHRPYTFTQLITLSDGSTFTQRTTSPVPVYKSIKDARNTPLWNPSNARLANVEEDEAGRLRAFRRRFGRGWDAEGVDDVEADADASASAESAEAEAEREGEGGYGGDGVNMEKGSSRRKQQAEKDTKKDNNKTASSTNADEWSDEAADNLMDLIGSFGAGAKELKGDVRTSGQYGRSAKGGKKR